ERLGHGRLGFTVRVAGVHFRGSLAGWLRIDRDIARAVARHVRTQRPDFVFAAFTGVDKSSHAAGHTGPRVREALAIVDDLAGEIRHDAEAAGVWEQTHLWVVSDHGHSPVAAHDDLAGTVRAAGYRAVGHPWVYGAWDVAVMVSGNAMAHLYLEREHRVRPWWPELAARWEPLAELLLERPSVDVAMLAHSPTRTEIRARGRGRAMLDVSGPADRRRFDYRPLSGDPLGVGELAGLDAADAHDACAASDYPDALVQIASLAGSARAGEIILSAARGWDFRARYEPIPHASAHGALHREHMLVPFLTNRPLAHAPRRTADTMPSALAALGVRVPVGLDGESFV
ncbi:MAG: alkaline phosphatase family protein, partial [Gemmatimonadaceae bacterium]